MAALEQTGQLSRFVENYLRRYARDLGKVRVFSRSPRGIPADFDGAVLFVRPRFTLSPVLEYLLFFFLYGLDLVRQCRLLRVMQASAAVPAILARVLFGIPYIVTFGYDYVAIERAGSQTWLKRWLKIAYLSAVTHLALLFASRVIVTNEEMLEKLTKSWKHKLAFIPNGVRLSLFQKNGEEKMNDDRFTIGYVGRLEPQKNIPALLDAVGLLGAAYPALSIHLDLIGDGSLRDELRTRASVLNDVQIAFHGALDHRQVPGILARCSCFVLPSLGEGHPKALLEAMAMGLPCVGTDVPGIRSVLQHGVTGVLVKTDAQSIAKGIASLIDDRQFAGHLGESAQKLVAQSYDLDDLLSQEIQLLRSVEAGP